MSTITAQYAYPSSLPSFQQPFNRPNSFLAPKFKGDKDGFIKRSSTAPPSPQVTSVAATQRVKKKRTRLLTQVQTGLYQKVEVFDSQYDFDPARYGGADQRKELMRQLRAAYPNVEELKKMINISKRLSKMHVPITKKSV